jgi:hypothetical protein
MLQRSPTYVISVPERDVISDKLRPYLPEKMVYRLARTRNVGFANDVLSFEPKINLRWLNAFCCKWYAANWAKMPI